MVGHLAFLIECHLFRITHEEVFDHRRQWQIHSHIVSLFIALSTEAEVGGGQGMLEEPYNVPLKVST
jgi:hypothetical protein